MPRPHPLLGPLGDVVGTWEGDGNGTLPGTDDFTWHEVLQITTPGTPVLAWSQRTTRPDGSPFHAEDGWLRVPPELQTDDGPTRVELAVTSPTGILEACAGTLEVDGAGWVVDASSTSIARTDAAGRVTSTRRRWALEGHVLVVDFWMSTPRLPDTFHHLTVRLERTT